MVILASGQNGYTLRVFAFVLGGTVLGGAAGIGVAMAAGVISARLNPQDPSAGSVAIMVVATFPLGVLFGVIVSVFAAKALLKKPPEPRGFEVTSTSGRRR